MSESFFSRYWRWELQVGETSSQTVEDELIRLLPHIDPKSWTERFELGGVYARGREALKGDKLYLPCRLEYYEPKLSLDELARFFPTVSEDAILFRDTDLAVVIKPAGLPTTPSRDQRLYHLERSLKTLLASNVHLPSRLDTGVKGVLLVSLSSRMNRALQRAYDKRQVTKRYIAEVHGDPAWENKVCTAPIVRDELHPVLRRCAASSELGEVAETRFSVVTRWKEQGKPRALLLAEPITGRTHQIRLHCQHEGLPIVGDPFYGYGDGGELRLLSLGVTFYHPYRREHMNFVYSPRQGEWSERVNDVGGVQNGIQRRG